MISRDVTKNLEICYLQHYNLFIKGKEHEI